jgi:Sap, sulfolipid-1-addressing protein
LPSQALALAFAASIYPPAVAAVIALGRGQQLRSRVFAFVLAAFLTTCAMGTVMLFLLGELGATTTTSRSVSAAIELGLGVLLIALAVRLQRKRPDLDAPEAPSGPSKIDRYLESRRLAFVLGITLYIIPSPIYIGAVKAIADAKLSTSSELLDLAVMVAVMLWMIEVPMLLLLVVPGHAERALDATNRWFACNGRTVAIVASAAAGAYLAIKGLLDLVS